jgi:hypothetical protein
VRHFRGRNLKPALTMLRLVPWLLSFFAASVVNLHMFYGNNGSRGSIYYYYSSYRLAL